MLLRQKKKNLDYWLTRSCEVVSAKKWIKISPNHIVKAMFFPITLPKKKYRNLKNSI
jgi:hypothetical protein